MAERIDLSEPIKDICEALGLDPNYVYEISIVPLSAGVFLFKGRDGRCKGEKYVDDNGQPAIEFVGFEITTHHA